jgi:hypothetical protein
LLLLRPWLLPLLLLLLVLLLAARWPTLRVLLHRLLLLQ